MRKPYQLLLFLLGVLVFAMPFVALADEVTDDQDTPAMHRLHNLRVGAARLRSSSSLPYPYSFPDTAWIGHIADATWVPKDNTGAALAGVPAGGYGPHHVGRGENLPSGDVSMGVAGGPDTHFNGVWDFDHFQAGDDTLQGWWPAARPGQSEGAGNPDDKVRGFFGLDYGNQGNYVINQGATAKRTIGVTGYWHRDGGSNTPGGVSGNNSVSGGLVGTVTWAPIAGSASAWCGLRVEGDLTAQDQVSLGGTGNYINSGVLQFNGNNSYNQVGSVSATGTDHNFPGVGSQWDQMLYRDIDISTLDLLAGDFLTVNFSYSHGLSKERGGTDLQRVGYFWKDPLTYNSNPVGGVYQANFISATDAQTTLSGPVDSFTVWVGVPIDGTFKASDGTIKSVYDTKRRWFGEVIRTLDNLTIPGVGFQAPLVRLLARSGFSTSGGGELWPNPTWTPPATATFSASVSAADLAAMAASYGSPRVRLVFRVKTNRGNDDEDSAVSGFNSGTMGAAIIDNVVVQKNGAGANLVTNGDFEAAGSINNDPGTLATSAWKSTGKPPGVYVHPHCVNSNCTQYTPGLWNDPCSPPNLSDASAPNRGCGMVGNVLSGGNHDAAEKPGGTFGAPDQDRQRLAVSPTIITATNSDGTSYNAMGLNKNFMAATTEWAIWFDIHTPGFRGSAGNGNLRSLGLQSWPASQPNGAKVWGEHRFSTGITFSTANSCAANFIALKTAGFVITSNTTGIPDSVRVYFQYISRCYTTSLTATTCSPTTGTMVGNYIDNLSLAFIKGTPTAGLSNFPWMWFCDAFPTYINPSTGVAKTDFSAAAFDTATAKVKAAINRTASTNTTTRVSSAGDSAQVTTGAIPGGGRVDMVFRILPGPGNYTTIGNRSSALRRVPTSATAAVANASSTNFWENYMGDCGNYGSTGAKDGGTGGGESPGGPHPVANRWDPNTWNSARMDTLERNLWPALSNTGNLATNSGGTDWQSTYHELDHRFIDLGVAKNRCFLVNPAAGAPVSCASRTPNGTAAPATQPCNVVCELLPGALPFGVYPPTWAAGAGLPASEGTNPATGLPMTTGQTLEFTKIIPDGMLTPGSHVQYFFLRRPGQKNPLLQDVWPDTTQVFDGPSADGGRWYNFNVLPDRWKDAVYGGGGTACMLVVDNFDRQGNEYWWKAACDTIGLTSAAKRGASDGYWATGGVNTPPGTFSEAKFRYDNGGQSGTLWDIFNVRASESLTTGAGWLASRITTAPPAGSFLDGKQTQIGPTNEMLRSFYPSAIIWLTGTAVGTNFGSVADRGDDEIAMMLDYMNPTLTAGTRAVGFWGSGFAENLNGAGGGPIPVGGVGFLTNTLGATLTNKAYRTYSGNPKPVATMYGAAGSKHDLYGNWKDTGDAYHPDPLPYGLSDGCGIENDVLALSGSTSTPGAAIQMYAENYGTLGPYGASVHVPSDGSGGVHPGITYLEGNILNRVASFAPVLPMMKSTFHWNVLKNVGITAGQVGCAPLQAPRVVGIGDNPGDGGVAFANFMRLRSANPMHSGEARLAFGLARTERVEVRVFDVTGRVVKTVANRVFVGGQEHVVIWNGTDEAGNKVKPGVFFYQLKTPTWTSQKKLAVLAN